MNDPSSAPMISLNPAICLNFSFVTNKFSPVRQTITLGAISFKAFTALTKHICNVDFAKSNLCATDLKHILLFIPLYGKIALLIENKILVLLIYTNQTLTIAV